MQGSELKKVVFSTFDPGTKEQLTMVGELLFVGVETVMTGSDEEKRRPYAVNRVVFVVLHPLTGEVYKIYNEQHIRIYNEKGKNT